MSLTKIFNNTSSYIFFSNLKKIKSIKINKIYVILGILNTIIFNKIKKNHLLLRLYF